MPSPEIEEFARLLMKHVRDKAIDSCDMVNDPKCNNVKAIRWRQKMKSGSIDELLREIIPDCVDDVIFYLLHSIDEEQLPLSLTTSSGKCVNLTTAGESEMAGYCVAGEEYDWRARFSKRRFNYDKMRHSNFEVDE